VTDGLQVEYVPLASVRGYERNARTQSVAQLAELVASIKEFGFTNPLLVDGQGEIIAGHGRLAAAKKLGMTTIPVITLRGLSAERVKALRLADNQLALNSGWNLDLLAAELEELKSAEFDLDVIGFSDEFLASVSASLNDSWSPEEPPEETAVDVPAVEKRVGVNLAIPAAVCLGKRDEIMALLDKMKAAYLCDVRVKE